jgi:hypothetical protein
MWEVIFTNEQMFRIFICKFMYILFCHIKTLISYLLKYQDNCINKFELSIYM